MSFNYSVLPPVQPMDQAYYSPPPSQTIYYPAMHGMPAYMVHHQQGMAPHFVICQNSVPNSNQAPTFPPPPLDPSRYSHLTQSPLPGNVSPFSRGRDSNIPTPLTPPPGLTPRSSQNNFNTPSPVNHQTTTQPNSKSPSPGHVSPLSISSPSSTPHPLRPLATPTATYPSQAPVSSAVQLPFYVQVSRDLGLPLSPTSSTNAAAIDVSRIQKNLHSHFLKQGTGGFFVSRNLKTFKFSAIDYPNLTVIKRGTSKEFTSDKLTVTNKDQDKLSTFVKKTDQQGIVSFICSNAPTNQEYAYYEGEWLDGLPHGQTGTLTLFDGTTYTNTSMGEWKEGLMHGVFKIQPQSSNFTHRYFIRGKLLD